MLALSLQRPNRTSFISLREFNPGSWRIFCEAWNSNALGTVVSVESGLVSFGVLPAQLHQDVVSSPPPHFSFALWNLSPHSVWNILLHLHLFTSTHYPGQSSPHLKIESVGIPVVWRRDIYGSAIFPLLSIGTRGHIPFCRHIGNWQVHRYGLLAQSRNSSLRAVTRLSRSPSVFPGWHPVYFQVPNGQCLGEVTRNSYHGADRQGIIKGVPPVPERFGRNSLRSRGATPVC